MKILLHDGVSASWFNINDIKAFLELNLPWLPVTVGGDLFSAAGREIADLPARLAGIRVHDPMKPFQPLKPMKPEVDYEQRVLAGETPPAMGVLYDGVRLQRLARECLRPQETGLSLIRVWFTRRLFATYDENDRRYHIRVCVHGLPSIISTAGMAAGPARARSYYLARRLGIPESQLEAVSEDDFIRPEDPRITEVAKGYAIQAVFYALTGRAFCSDPSCRLFNAHWQKEMLAAQTRGPDFCEPHRQMLERWKEKPPEDPRGLFGFFS